jgi:hypothetical protein
MMKLEVKILGCKTPQRYAIWRAVLAATAALQETQPDLQVEVVEVKERVNIEKYTPVTVYPSLVVNEQLVCVGRFPKKEEIVGWLQQSLEAAGEANS